MTKSHACIVKWRDSATFRGWQAIDSDRHDISTITSIGWLIRETKKAVTLTTGISHCGNVVDAITIPRECVTEMTKLKNYVEG